MIVWRVLKNVWYLLLFAGALDSAPEHKNSFIFSFLSPGGTGITPMLQLITDVFRNSSDRTELALLFANQSEADILVREELERFQKEFPDRFKLWYTVDRPAEGDCAISIVVVYFNALESIEYE